MIALPLFLNMGLRVAPEVLYTPCERINKLSYDIEQYDSVEETFPRRMGMTTISVMTAIYYSLYHPQSSVLIYTLTRHMCYYTLIMMREVCLLNSHIIPLDDVNLRQRKLFLKNGSTIEVSDHRESPVFMGRKDVIIYDDRVSNSVSRRGLHKTISLSSTFY